RAGEEQHDGRHVLWLGDAPQPGRVVVRRDAAGGEEATRVRRRRREAVDVDLVRPQLLRQAPGVVRDRGLGRRVDDALTGGQVAGDRADVDDLAGPPFAHVLSDVLARIHRGEQVALEDGADVVRLDVEGGIRGRSRGAGADVPARVVDEDVDPTEVSDDLLYQTGGLARVGEVGRIERGPPSE